jgi:hypothetical protein
MAVAAVALSVAATGLQVAGTLQAGQAAAAGENQRAQQAANASAIGRAKAAQTDAYMRDSLASTMGNIMAVRAAANTDPSSPTGFAVLNRQENLGDEARAQKVANINNQADSDASAAIFYRNSAENALTGSYLSAGGRLASGLSSQFSSF